jgi:MipA family protein
MKRSGIRNFSGLVLPRALCVGAALVAAVVAAGQAASQDLVDALAGAPDIPNIAGLAFGSAPRYVGADERMAGAVPLLRLQRAGSMQSLSLLGTVFTSNILDHPVLKTGPTGIYRLGRRDVDDDVVAHLPDIDPSLDLGWTVGAEFVDPENSARRVRADVSFRHDVTGTHGGYVLGASASGWTPTPFFLLGGFAAVTWGSEEYMDTYFGIEPSGAAASGLPAFNARAGARDIAAGLVAIIPVNDRMLAGAGVLYSRLLNDAADSPIVDLRGERDQLLYGIGAAWAF